MNDSPDKTHRSERLLDALVAVTASLVLAIFIFLAFTGCATAPMPPPTEPSTEVLFAIYGPDLSTWPTDAVLIYMGHVHHGASER